MAHPAPSSAAEPEPERVDAASAPRDGADDAALRRAAIRDSFAVGIATAAYGVSFGALSVAAGLDIWQTSFLSLVMFTGGSQYALVGVLAGGGTTAGGSAIATAAMLGIRNVVYGMRMKPLVDRGGMLRRVAAAWITIDESTAVALARTDDRAARVGFWVTGIVIFVGWNLTTFAGAVIGDALGDTKAWGLDAAAAAAFLGLLWPRLKRFQAGAVAVAAALVATVSTPLVMPGLPVLIAAAVAVVVGWFDLFSPEEASMTTWHIILIASATTLALKLGGYLVPAGLLERERPARIADLLTVALLAALIAVQGLAAGQHIVIDARVPAVIVAAALFALRVPFIIVVVVAALVAAGIRAFA